jgi:hypothetical protein
MNCLCIKFSSFYQKFLKKGIVMKTKSNRSGTSQDNKLLEALQPDYVSVEERSMVDLLKYIRKYALNVRFYDENNESVKLWSSFLNLNDQEITELAEFADNPALFKEDAGRFSKYSKPHLAVLLTFLKLLQYPQAKFAALTEKKVAYFYRNLLKLEEREEVPDQVHVIFQLARDVREHLLKKGTLIHAGKDNTGVDLNYEVTEDIVLNNAMVADIKTIHFQKTIMDIKQVHQSYDKGDTGFEKILCLVLGNIANLPPYQTAQGNTIAVDGRYLRTEIYKRVKGKEKDELAPRDADYIFQSLCFRFLKDFMYCLDLYYREMNRGYVGIVYPEDWEWEKAYTILEEVHRERIARGRRQELKAIHKELGFESMMEFAFGEPDPGNMLYKMPGSISTLEELAEAKNEAVRKYIENKLCMTSDDFRVIMAGKDIALDNTAGDEIYTLLEAAWTKKRGFRYPDIGSEKIAGYYADTVLSADKEQAVPRFQPFGKSSETESSGTINMGFAVSSPLLNLYEGNRTIEMVISCKEGTIEYDNISALLAGNRDIFSTCLSVAGGWREAEPVDFEIGKFIIKPELKTYSRKDSYLTCDTLYYPQFNAGSEGKYLVFPNHKVYKIKTFDEKNTRILLTSVPLEYPANTPTLIKKLVPKIFGSELREALNIPESADTVYSRETFSENFQGKYLVDTTGKIFSITRFVSADEAGVRYCGDITPEVLKLEETLASNISILKSPREIFNDHHQGKYLVDGAGNIFLITQFISAGEVKVAYFGNITLKSADIFSEEQRLMLNKIWGNIEPQFEENEIQKAVGGLSISGIYTAQKDYTFKVTDGALAITYPEGATAESLVNAWEAWKDNPLNRPGRYEIKKTGSAAWSISPASVGLEKTGEIIGRYESASADGIRIIHRGRPSDTASLLIEEPSVDNDNAGFMISGDTLTITPGRVSQTANQITADWQAWVKAGNDPKNFHIESKDDHIWNAAPVSEEPLTPLDKAFKKCEVCDPYGDGIRVVYTGPVAAEPKLILKENNIDMFEFTIDEPPGLTIKYPSASSASSYELLESWREWKASELNDPGSFDMEPMGDGLWTVQAATERELKASENQIIECTIPQAGIIARYKLSAGYANAMIELKKDQEATSFDFGFSDFKDEAHNNVNTQKLTITYPPLPAAGDETAQSENQVRHVQSLLSQWSRENKKRGFTLVRIADNVKWARENFPDTLPINFLDELNYIHTVNPDGFIVKYKPDKPSGVPLTQLYKAKVVIHENGSNTFAFHLSYDYLNDQKVFYIKYPTDKVNRTVTELLKAWKNEAGSLLEEDSPYWQADGILKEFSIEPSGTGKWEIAGITEVGLTSAIPADTRYTDPVNQDFFEYQTSDVKGFTVNYTGPKGIHPRVTIEANQNDTFAISITPGHHEFFDVEVGQDLKIKYPKRADKRKVIDLLTAWNNYKKSNECSGIDILGFEITDTSPVVGKRAKSALLSAGDLVREYQAGLGDGLCISYTGHRDDPVIEMAPAIDFTNDDVDKHILWDNGEVFIITQKLDKSTVMVKTAGRNIQCLDAIKLYENDAIGFDALKFTIRLDEEFPPLAPATEGNLSADPMIKILLKHPTSGGRPDENAIFYEYFKSIGMQRIDLKVTVQGLKDIKMRGNIAMINPANPFNPFGLTPDTLARFYFANREICEKKLDSLRLNVAWDENQWVTGGGLPDMEKYYFGYSRYGLEQAGTISNEDFEVKLQFMDRRTWIPISRTPQPLFSRTWGFSEFGGQTYQRNSFTVDRDIPRDPLDWPRYYKLELSNQGFMKDLYQELMDEAGRVSSRITAARNTYDIVKQEIKDREEQIKAARVAEAEARANKGVFNPPLIPEARELPQLPENDKDRNALALNAPYTPVIRSIVIDYTASAKILLDSELRETVLNEIPVQLYRFHPFGYEELGASGTQDDFLLPQYDQDGYLLIGLRNLAPLQTVSLLFQMVSGSGDVNLEAPEIAWSYLASNQWIPFKQSEILKDTTSGLQDTGIIQFSIPAGATTTNTVLPGSLCWIRAAAQSNIAAVPDMLDIRAGSICAIYRNQNNDPNHLVKPLAADTIKELAERDPAIKEVIQPYTSFNGKRREEGLEFYNRVSERLKHKNRALTLDDYERMILAQFPQVYKVKCVPQDECTRVGAELLAPEAKGEVVVIVILKNSNAKPFFPLKPKTPANILEEIKRHIQSYMPPLVTVSIRNPRFEEIRYRLAVKFKEGSDRGFYINQLNEDIKRFLSPWAYEKEAAISFGSSVYSSAVINYIENRDYVDYVANFSLIQQIIRHENYIETIPLFLTEDNAATAKYPDSILVSAESHIIDVITTENYDPGAFSGIGHMRIETDFWISRPGPVFSVGIGEMEIEAWPVLRYAFAGIPGPNFSREDSQRIWTTLKAAEYIDSMGNVSVNTNLYVEDPQITVTGIQSLEDYFTNTFKLINGKPMKDSVVSILKTNLDAAQPILWDAFTNIPGADFSANDSEQIWNTLKAAGYIDDNGYVVPKTDLSVEDPPIMVTGKQSFEDYLKYTFEFQNGKETKDAVAGILKTGLEFDGVSQYPFIVY